MRVLWAHGLEGSPGGSKPTYLAEELGWDVLAPEMNAYGWTIAEQTRAVGDAIARDAIVGGPDLDVLMGSSYGALALANAAAVIEGNGSNTPRLVLLAPAFGLAENFRATVGERLVVASGKNRVLGHIFIMGSAERSNSAGISCRLPIRCRGLKCLIRQSSSTESRMKSYPSKTLDELPRNSMMSS